VLNDEGGHGFRAIREKMRRPHIFFATALRPAGWTGKEGASPVPKPPTSTPHSDIDGVHRDERPNVETANEAGQDSGTVAKDQKRSVGYPDYTDDQPEREDRSA
jgi:hypothetical protein